MKGARALPLALLALAALTLGARADGPAPFYQGKQLRIVSGTAVSESTASYERILARFMPKYIPGNPVMTTESMPGAGGVTAANSVANVAPRDGTVMASVHGFVPLMPLFGMEGPRFDALELRYIGSMYRLTGLCIGMKRDHIESIADLQTRETVVGTSGPVTEILTFYNTLKAMLGLKLKVIYGYASSSTINLALERGELQARCGVSWTSLLASRPAWTRGEDINILLQLRLEKDPALPNVPVLGDLVTKPEDRAAIAVLAASPELGYPLFLPPGVPADRVASLRQAFDRTMQDPEFQGELARQQLALSPSSGDAIQTMIARLYQTPADVMTRVRALVAPRDARQAQP